MATGDIQGNLERLRVQLRTIAYPQPLDLQGLREGIPAAILPLLHHALLGYSRHVARYLSTHGYELFAKSDLRFVECLLKYLREEFGYRCPLTVAQIFSRGFAERKLIFIHDVIQVCKRKHNELVKQARQANPLRKMKTESFLADVTRYHSKETLPKETEAGNSVLANMNDGNVQGVERSKSRERQRVACRATVNVTKPVSNVNELQSQKHAKISNLSSGNDISDEATLEVKQLPESKGNQHDERSTSTAFIQLSKPVDCEKKHELSTELLSSIDECYKALKKQIMDVADNMEKHFAILEGDVSRNTETLKAKLVILEGQVHVLSQMIPAQLHSTKQTMARPDGQNLVNAGIALRRPDENVNGFHVPSTNAIRDISNTHQIKAGIASRVSDDHVNNFHVPLGNTMQDISNTHQKINQGLVSRLPGLEMPTGLRSDLIQNQQRLSTQELIASVKARCNKTKELLFQNGWGMTQ